jgi:hypothetical protein
MGPGYHGRYRFGVLVHSLLFTPTIVAPDGTLVPDPNSDDDEDFSDRKHQALGRSGIVSSSTQSKPVSRHSVMVHFTRIIANELEDFGACDIDPYNFPDTDEYASHALATRRQPKRGGEYSKRFDFPDLPDTRRRRRFPKDTTPTAAVLDPQTKKMVKKKGSPAGEPSMQVSNDVPDTEEGDEEGSDGDTVGERPISHTSSDDEENDDEEEIESAPLTYNNPAKTLDAALRNED